jgi:hypothetical protein
MAAPVFEPSLRFTIRTFADSQVVTFSSIDPILVIAMAMFFFVLPLWFRWLSTWMLIADCHVPRVLATWLFHPRYVL